MLMSSDMLHATLGYNHTGLESMDGFGPDFNIGYIFIRHTAVEFVPQRLTQSICAFAHVT